MQLVISFDMEKEFSPGKGIKTKYLNLEKKRGKKKKGEEKHINKREKILKTPFNDSGEEN